MNTALTAYIALKWSTLLIFHGYHEHLIQMDESLAKLIEAQANLSAAALASADKKLANKVYMLLAHEWEAIKDIEPYVEHLIKLELGNGVIILASLLTKYLVATKKNDLVEHLKVSETRIYTHIHIIF